MRSRGIVSEINATSAGKLARFTSFTVSMAGMPRMAAPRARASAITRSTCSRVTNGRTASCTRTISVAGSTCAERVRDGLLAGVAAMHHAGWATQSCLGDFVLQRDNIVGARGDEKVGDGGAGGQTPQRENNQRHAVQLEELLRQIGAHAGAEAGSRERWQRFGSSGGIDSLAQLSRAAVEHEDRGQTVVACSDGVTTGRTQDRGRRRALAAGFRPRARPAAVLPAGGTGPRVSARRARRSGRRSSCPPWSGGLT